MNPQQQVAEWLRHVVGWTGFALKLGNDVKRLRLSLYVDLEQTTAWWSGTLHGLELLLPGLDVRVVRTGRFAPPFLATGSSGPISASASQLRSGGAVQTSRTNIRGSIGFFTRNTRGTWLVSANHVLSGNGSIQPAPGNGHVYIPGGFLPHLGDTVVAKTIVAGQPNTIDAAACLLKPLLPPVPYPAPPAEPFLAAPYRPQHGERVFLMGSGGRSALVREADSNKFRLNMENVNIGNLSEAEFVDQILVRGESGPFANHGDSGGLVVAVVEGRTRPVGLVIGRARGDDQDYAIVTPIQAILDSPELSLGTLIS